MLKCQARRHASRARRNACPALPVRMWSGLSRGYISMPLFANDPTEAMETAKAIIGGKIKVDYKDLVAVAQDPTLNKWQRIAAIYALGFSGENRWAAPLRDLLSDPKN